MNNNQLKLKVHDTHKEDEKITTNFKAVIDADVINEAYVDEKFLKINCHLTILEKGYNEFNLQYNTQSVEEILF